MKFVPRARRPPKINRPVRWLKIDYAGKLDAREEFPAEIVSTAAVSVATSIE